MKNVKQVYEKDPYNSRQNFLYKRSLIGVGVYDSAEIADMSNEKLKRINKIYRKTQTILNLWKQEILISNTNQMINNLFGQCKYGLLKEIISNTTIDKEFICTLSFKDLSISKHDVINRLIVEKILPKNFHELKPTEYASRIPC
jgi:hypothetical protein|tara:strand:+ start:3104 stop:3535 length:432 start_codon:yes stop_codon:yes gene_type:complete